MSIKIELDGVHHASFLGSDLNAAFIWAFDTMGEEVAAWCVFYPVGFNWA